MKAIKFDHDKALEMTWSGQLYEYEVIICDIVAGGYASSIEVSNEHYENFNEKEILFGCSIHD